MMLSDPTFYVLIAFTLFFVCAGKPLYKAVTGALDGQIKKIETDIDHATRAREEAQLFLNETKLKLHQATKVSQDILAQAKEIIASLELQADQNLKEMLIKRRQLADNRMTLLITQAQQEIRSVLADEIITNVKKSLIHEKLNARLEQTLSTIQKSSL